MPTNYDVKHIRIRALHDWVIVSDMEFGEVTTASGLVIKSDNGKTHGIKPRWGQVYCVGPTQKDVQVGNWILVEHGRWTRGMHINDGEREVTVQRVEVKSILAVTDHKPTDLYWGQEYANGDSVDIRPEDFGAR